jgi:hypothetical protein
MRVCRFGWRARLFGKHATTLGSGVRHVALLALAGVTFTNIVLTISVLKIDLALRCFVVTTVVSAITGDRETLLAGGGITLVTWFAITDITLTHIVLAVPVLVFDRARRGCRITAVREAALAWCFCGSWRRPSRALGSLEQN